MSLALYKNSKVVPNGWKVEWPDQKKVMFELSPNLLPVLRTHSVNGSKRNLRGSHNRVAWLHVKSMESLSLPTALPCLLDVLLLLDVWVTMRIKWHVITCQM